MDTTDPDIAFDPEGMCNHCREYDEQMRRLGIPDDPAEAWRRLERLAERIRREGRGSDYDCLLGVSGGVDSSYVAYLAKRLLLRPLVVHFDNGWDGEIAVQNINNIVERLGVDLHTYVVNWEEFKDLQRAFFRASVVDIEMLTDHAQKASTCRLTRSHGIKYVLMGNNVATEFGLPRSWRWQKQDLVNIRAIHRRFGQRRLHSYPTLNTLQWVFRRFTAVCPLDMIRYRKTEAVETLSRDMGWRYYGGKHYESVFTKFYQAYVLPVKFGIDKRKAHFSSLIRNGEMTREDAGQELRKPPYEPEELERDKIYVLKKLEFSPSEFDEIMSLPVRSHLDYWSEWHVLRYLRWLNPWSLVKGRA